MGAELYRVNRSEPVWLWRTVTQIEGAQRAAKIPPMAHAHRPGIVRRELPASAPVTLPPGAAMVTDHEVARDPDVAIWMRYVVRIGVVIRPITDRDRDSLRVTLCRHQAEETEERS